MECAYGVGGEWTGGRARTSGEGGTNASRVMGSLTSCHCTCCTPPPPLARFVSLWPVCECPYVPPSIPPLPSTGRPAGGGEGGEWGDWGKNILHIREKIPRHFDTYLILDLMSPPSLPLPLEVSREKQIQY